MLAVDLACVYFKLVIYTFCFFVGLEWSYLAGYEGLEWSYMAD